MRYVFALQGYFCRQTWSKQILTDSLIFKKYANRRAVVVAVARKLAVLMHRLWKTGEVYDPFYNSKKATLKAA